MFENGIQLALNILAKKGGDILSRRYGLTPKCQCQTLQAIGNDYKITRERVRQIEESSLVKIKRNKELLRELIPIQLIQKEIENFGGAVREDLFLLSFSPNPYFQNIVLFFLELDEQFKKIKEDGEFFTIWTIDEELIAGIKNLLKKIYQEILEKNKIIEEKVFFEKCSVLADETMVKTYPCHVLSHWLCFARFLGKNIFSEWGPNDSPFISPRGIRDLSRLILEKENKPFHFSDLSRLIEEKFLKKAHPQTVHNELIKNPEFVLIGRGIYALKKWGYEPGIAREIIAKILAKNGPMMGEKITKEVLKQRILKPGTIATNLQNKKYFKKTENGFYALI